MRPPGGVRPVEFRSGLGEYTHTVTTSFAERRGWLERAFSEAFGGAPSLWVRAPGRVDLMGSHTDYNLGHVLTLAIDRDTWLAAAPRGDGVATVLSLNSGSQATFDVASVPAGEVGWHSYVHGVVHVLREAGYACPGFDAVVHGTIPIASGLSSSASLEAATGRLVEALGGHTLAPEALAQWCQQAENEVVGVSCGILDQFSSLLGQEGRALLLDCRDLSYRHAPIAAGLALVVADTRAPRRLAGSEYGERRADCEEGVRRLREQLPEIRSLRDVAAATLAAHASALPERVARRCRFVVEEDARVFALAAALAAGDRSAAGALCDASFAGARDLYELVVPEMEAMVAAMNASPGVVGARQAGAGFGGCMVGIVEGEAIAEFTRAAESGYRERSGRDGDVYEVRPTAGAGVFDPR